MSLVFALMAIPVSAALISGTAAAPTPTAPFTQCPAVGFNTSCSLLVNVTGGGTTVLQDTGATTAADPVPGTYDGSDDTLVGIINNSTAPLSQITLSSATEPIFGFDGDGICENPNATSGLPGLTGSDCNSTDTTGYGGPNSYFTNISADQMSGTVNFITPLAPGGSTYFSLEEQLSAADVTPVTVGGIEICKASVTGPLAVQGPFTFTVGDGVGSVTVNSGSCSPLIPVSGSSVSVTEASATWYSTSSIATGTGETPLTAGDGTTVGTYNLTSQEATVGLTAGQSDIVTFTNTIDPGFLKVCKLAATGSGLTSSTSYGFKVKSPLPVANDPNGVWNTTVTVPVGQCSSPIEVPAGTSTVTETGPNLYITNITASNAAGTAGLLVSPNYVAGTAGVVVNPGDVSTQTDVYFTNNVVAFKVCKTWDPTYLGNANSAVTDPVTTYPFTVVINGTTTTDNVAPGSCSVPVYYPAGTNVTVTEGIVPGTKVESITWPASNSSNLAGSALSETGSTTSGTGANAVTSAPSSADLNRTITLTLGTLDTSSATVPGNEADVTFTNRPADPGSLEICKSSVTGEFAVTGAYTFTLTPGPSSASVSETVNVGACVIVPGYAYNTNVTVAEQGLSATNLVAGITVAPPTVNQITSWVGGVPVYTATAESSTVGTASPSTGTVEVTIGEGNNTDVTYTDMDPPVGYGDSGNSGSGSSGVVTVTTPGPNGSTTTAISGSFASTIASGIATVVATSPTSVATNVPAVSGGITALTPSEKKALLKKDKRALVNLKSEIAKEQKLFSKSVGKKAVVASRKLAALKATERALNAQIKSLK